MSEITKLATQSKVGLMRTLMGGALGVGMVGLLFWAMQYMIQITGSALSNDESIQFVDFVRVEPDNTPVKKRRPPEKPPLPEKPPKQPPPPKLDNIDHQAETIQVTAPTVDTDVEMNDAGFSVGAIGEGEYLPIVKIAPIYPTRAADRGVEGHCTVIYTVTKQGTTADIRVDQNDCTSSLFHRASIQAAGKFKYKPRIRNGEAIEVPNIKNRFTYKLEK